MVEKAQLIDIVGPALIVQYRDHVGSSLSWGSKYLGNKLILSLLSVLSLFFDHFHIFLISRITSLSFICSNCFT